MKKLSYEYVKEYIEGYNGYKLLSEEYKNSKEKLKVKCPEGHIYEVIFSNFQRGQRCPYCYGKIKLSSKYVKEYIESFCYKMLSNEYKNARTKLEVECPYGHRYFVSWYNFKSGKRCPYCNSHKQSRTQSLEYDYVKSVIEGRGYKLISREYKNARTKLEVECPYGHRYFTWYDNFRRGFDCPTCVANTFSSKPEKAIGKYIEEIYKGKILKNDRTTIKSPITGNRLELDIYLPEINGAIEFNGTYYHSFDKVKINDELKRKECERMGISLLVIEESKWRKDKESCLQDIKKFIMSL